MIHYYGGPITPRSVAYRVWDKRHGLISFRWPEQLDMVQEYCQSYVLDCGAYSFWKSGHSKLSWDDYYLWIEQNMRHPRFDWAIIPDIIDGDEPANDEMLKQWPFGSFYGVPVFHIHESDERLVRLMSTYPRIAIGSSGAYSSPNSGLWWGRMNELREIMCDEYGRPKCKFHGLRQMNKVITKIIPYSSVDSTTVSINAALDSIVHGVYREVPKEIRALALAERLEATKGASVWLKQQ